ncbi:MAG: hypothetical protein ACI8PT_003389 [Gammaproteobacteria bacterium]|jgi:hypothetical protein
MGPLSGVIERELIFLYEIQRGDIFAGKADAFIGAQTR